MEYRAGRRRGLAVSLWMLLGIGPGGALLMPGATYGEATAPIQAIGVENQYANIIAQIGGDSIQVAAIVTDPNTDPHSFEASPKIARRLATADLVVENGLGYDDWAGRIVAANPRAGRKVISVQHLLGLPDDTTNPHLWYDPATMIVLARQIAVSLSALRPAQSAYFTANAAKFIASLDPVFAAAAAFGSEFPQTPVAVSEPVANDLLQDAGVLIRTPFSLQAAVMNGTDPAPQDVTAQNDLFTHHAVKLFLYNRQVTDPLTEAFLTLARKNGIPVVGVYETMPEPGYDYQSWMLATLAALRQAVTKKISTETLPGIGN